MLPSVPGWEIALTWQGLPPDFQWQPGAGHDGTAAVGASRCFRPVLQAKVPVQPGHRYRVTAWYRTEWEAYGEHHSLRWGVDGITWPLPATGGEWRQVDTTFTASGAQAEIAFTPRSLNKGEWTWFDDVALVEISPGETMPGERTPGAAAPSTVALGATPVTAMQSVAPAASAVDVITLPGAEA